MDVLSPICRGCDQYMEVLIDNNFRSETARTLRIACRTIAAISLPSTQIICTHYTLQRLLCSAPKNCMLLAMVGQLGLLRLARTLRKIATSWPFPQMLLITPISRKDPIHRRSFWGIVLLSRHTAALRWETTGGKSATTMPSQPGHPEPDIRHLLCFSSGRFRPGVGCFLTLPLLIHCSSGHEFQLDSPG
jgi:hypothetical protein